MDLSLIVNVTLNRNNPSLARAGFGTPLIFGYIDTAIIPPADRTRLYASATGLSDMIDDGFTTNHPVYKAAAALVAQNPCPQYFKVGRGALDFTHAVELLPDTFASGDTISFTVTKGTTSRTYTRTCGGVSLAAEAIAIALDMNNDASGWGTSGTGELTIAAVGNDVEIDAVSPANDNEMWYYSSLSNISLTDVTADRGTGIADDLAAILTADDDWYCLLLADAFGAVEIEAAADWIESYQKICVAATQDRVVATAGTGIINTLKTSSNERTFMIYSPHSMAEYPAAAVAGRFLPEEPGEVVWADKSLSGVTYWEGGTTAQLQNVEKKDGDLRFGNHYTKTAGVGNLRWGVTPKGEYIDIIRLGDWAVARCREDIFSAHRANKKIAFTDSGIALITGIIEKRLKEKVQDGFVDGSVSVDAPLASDVTAADKAARKLPGVVANAQFSGAILYTELKLQLAF